MRIILKLGGNVVLDPLQVAVAAQELSVLLAEGHQVTVVHGGGPQLDAALGALGETTVKVAGLRVTSQRAAQVVCDVMDRIGAELASRLQGHGLACRHLSSAAQVFDASCKDDRLGRVGTVTAVRLGAAASVVEVITPVGWDTHGPLNVNADEGACAVAAAEAAHWLVLGTDVEAVRGADGEGLRRLAGDEALGLVGSAATGGMVPKLRNAVAALEAGVGAVLVGKLAPGFARRLLAGNPDGTVVTAGPPGSAAAAGRSADPSAGPSASPSTAGPTPLAVPAESVPSAEAAGSTEALEAVEPSDPRDLPGPALPGGLALPPMASAAPA